MSDWDFLHDMHDGGYSADAISDATAIGYSMKKKVLNTRMITTLSMKMS